MSTSAGLRTNWEFKGDTMKREGQWHNTKDTPVPQIAGEYVEIEYSGAGGGEKVEGMQRTSVWSVLRRADRAI